MEGVPVSGAQYGGEELMKFRVDDVKWVGPEVEETTGGVEGLRS